MCELLVEHGADVCKRDALGETALMRAIEGHNLAIATWLIQLVIVNGA